MSRCVRKRSKEGAHEDGGEEGRSIQPAWMEDGKHGIDRAQSTTAQYQDGGLPLPPVYYLLR